MTVQDLKTILINHLNLVDRKKGWVNREILDHLLKGDGTDSISGAEITAFQVNGTTILLSDAGFSLPKNIVFMDLKSGFSCIETEER